MMYGYVYLTIDNLKGYFYIGQHKGAVHDQKYFGSGIKIQNIIKKRGGTETLRNYVLQWCGDKETLDLAEQYWIQCYREQYNSRVLNISNGGESVMSGRNHSKQTKSKISEKLSGRSLSEETRMKMSASRKGVTHPWKKKPLSEETKAKLRNTKWINNGNESKMVSLEVLNDYLSTGWVLGRKRI